MTLTGGLQSDFTGTLHQENTEGEVPRWIIDVRDLPTVKKDSDRCRHIMKVSDWLHPDFARELHQVNLEPGLRPHPTIEPGLQGKDLPEIIDLLTKNIHIETDLQETPGETDQLTKLIKQVTLQTDIEGEKDQLTKLLKQITLQTDIKGETDQLTKLIKQMTLQTDIEGEKVQLTKLIKQMTLQTDIKGNPDILDRHLLGNQGLQEPEEKIAHHPAIKSEAEAEVEEEVLTSLEAMDQPREQLEGTTLNWPCLRLK